MPKLHSVSHQPGDGQADYVFWCPACQCGHGVWTTGKNGVTGAVWNFNGNMEKPTFTPSLRIEGPMKSGGPVVICHTNVTDGMIQYHSDCTHAFAGKRVPMEDF